MPVYSYEDACRRIEAAIRDDGRPTKAIYESIGLTKDAWSRKIRGTGSHFSWGEFSAIAQLLDAPPGWPFVEWEVANANRRALAALERTAAPPDPRLASPAARPGKQKTGGK